MSLYSYIYQKSQTAVQTKDQRIRKILIHSTTALFSLFIVLLSSLLLTSIDSYSVSPVSATSDVVSTQTNSPISITSFVTSSPTPSTPTPTLYQLDDGRIQDGNALLSPTPPAPNEVPNEAQSAEWDEVGSPPSKKLYTIAVIGDSMVDTMGEVLEYLDSALKKKYPQTRFLLYNYGTGAQNIEMGLARFGSHFKYQSRDYQSLPELKPDILIVASFSYNPFTPHDRDRHWLTLTRLVEQAKTVSQNVYMLAEIAPLRADFGKGPQGVNWSNDSNYEHSGRIIEQLQNAVGLSKALNIPLIDAFSPSFSTQTQEGKREYVNPSDGIHPSVEGHRFMAEKIAQTIRLP